MSAQLMKVKDYVIAAGATLRLEIPGVYFQLAEAPAEVDIEFFRSQSSVGRATGIPEGFEFGPLPRQFDAVAITSATAQTVKVAIARELARLNRLAGAIEADISKSETLDSLPDLAIGAGAIAQITASDGDRRAILITNLKGNAAEIRVGDAGAGAANGTPVQPGETLTLPTSAAVHVLNTGAGAQSVAITLIKD